MGPVGLEPTTNGLKELRRTEGSRAPRFACDQDVTSLARRILERAAAGAASRAELEQLARAVLTDRRFALAHDVLKGDEWALVAGLDLAGEVLRAAAARRGAA